MNLRRLLALPPADPDLPGAGWLFLCSLSLFLVAQGVLASLAGFSGGTRPPVPVQVRLFCGVWFAAALPILLGGFRAKGGTLSLGLGPGKLNLRALLGGAAVFFAGLLLWFPLFTAYFQVLQALGVPRTPQPVYQWIAKNLAGSHPDFLLLFLVIFVLPFFEELAFRGLIQSWLRSLLPRGLAVVLTALLFGLAHEPWIMKFPVFLLGLFFGYARERTGSLWASWTAHVLHNGLAVAFVPYLIHFYSRG